MLKEFKDIRVGQLFTVYLGQFVYEKIDSENARCVQRNTIYDFNQHMRCTTIG